MTNFPRVFELALLLGALLLPVTANAQQQNGWYLDPYAGLNAAFLQPAATAAIPYNWDVQLGAFGAAVNNNYSFLRNASGLGFLRDAGNSNQGDFDHGTRTFTLGEHAYQYDFPEKGRPVFARVASEITGPSFSLQLGRYTRVGAFSRLRGLVSVSKLDRDLHFYPYNNVPFGIDIQINEAFAAGAVWGEIGLNLSRAFPVGNDAEIRLGVSPRILRPTEGIAFHSSAGGIIRQVGRDSIIVSNVDTELSFTDGVRDGDQFGGQAGDGFAIDLGIQFAWGASYANDYLFTAGISLLDLGSMSFREGAQNYQFTNPAEVLLIREDYDFSSPEDTDASLAYLGQQINGTGSGATTGGLTVGMPTTISAQFGFQPSSELRLSAAYRGDAPFTLRQLSYGQELVTAIHYSRWWYGGGLTAGVYDWREFNLGFQLRLGPVYVGTDRLMGTFLRKAKLYGGSFYAGVRITDFSPNNRGGNGRGARSRRGGKEVKCYPF